MDIREYEKELEKFDSNITYLSWLADKEKLLYEYIELELIDFINLSNNKTIYTGSFIRVNNTKSMSNKSLLRIYFDSPVYEALALIQEYTEDIKQFVYEVTRSNFLSTIKDINIGMISDYRARKLLQGLMYANTITLLNILLDRYDCLDKVVYVGNSEILVNVPEDIGVITINSIYNQLASYNKHINVELVNCSNMGSNKKDLNIQRVGFQASENEVEVIKM